MYSLKGYPARPPISEVIFLSPFHMYALSLHTVYPGQILICGSGFTCLGRGEGLAEVRFQNRLSPELAAAELIGSCSLGRNNWDSALSR